MLSGEHRAEIVQGATDLMLSFATEKLLFDMSKRFFPSFTPTMYKSVVFYVSLFLQLCELALHSFMDHNLTGYLIIFSSKDKPLYCSRVSM